MDSEKELERLHKIIERQQKQINDLIFITLPFQPFIKPVWTGGASTDDIFPPGSITVT